MTANLPMGGYLINNVGNPSVSTDAANKSYVDSSITTAKGVTITGTSGLTGGGDLTANRTISVASAGITSSMLASNSVVTAAITDANVTTAKIADGAITPAKLNGAQSGSAPIYGARAWVAFSVSGGVPTIYGSANIASVVKASSGKFTVTFTTGPGSTSYAVNATFYSASGSLPAGVAATNKTSSSVQLVFWSGTGPGVGDPDGGEAVFFW